MEVAEDLVFVQERLNKQNFLRSEIIDAGYDPSIFKSFCEEVKPESKFFFQMIHIIIFFYLNTMSLMIFLLKIAGTNIDGWTMDELNKAIFELI